MSTRNLWRPVPEPLDPDFDDLGYLGGLTCAQIRDPVYIYNEPSAEIFLPDYRKRVCRNIDPRWGKLAVLSDRLQRAMYWKLRWTSQDLQNLGNRLWPPKRQAAHARERLQSKSQRFIEAQLKGYPQFNFHWFRESCRCNHCIPYNGHFTPNYWMVRGQKDPW